MSEAALKVDALRAGENLILTPRGDVDMTVSPLLKHEVRRAVATLPVPRRLILDLSGVGYMDSSGLAVLVEAQQAARKGGYRLVVCGLTPKVKAIFDIAKLGMVFTVTGTLEQAQGV